MRSQAVEMNPRSNPGQSSRIEFLVENNDKYNFSCKFGFGSVELQLVNKQLFALLANGDV